LRDGNRSIFAIVALIPVLCEEGIARVSGGLQDTVGGAAGVPIWARAHSEGLGIWTFESASALKKCSAHFCSVISFTANFAEFREISGI